MRTKLIVTALLVLAVGGIELTAQALSWTVTFTASPDHAVTAQQVAVVTSYELQVFAPGSSTVTTTVPLGKPTPNAQNQIVANVDTALKALPASVNCVVTAPTAAQCYTGKIRTVGPGGEGVSVVSDPFPLVPGAPAATGKPAFSRQ